MAIRMLKALYLGFKLNLRDLITCTVLLFSVIRSVFNIINNLTRVAHNYSVGTYHCTMRKLNR